MEYLKKAYSWTGLLLLGSLLLLLSGCGSSSRSEYALSPEELEVSDTLKAFALALERQKLDDSLGFVASGLRYSTNGDYTTFQTRLDNFFKKAKINYLQINDIGVLLSSDDFAEANGQLEIGYNETEEKSYNIKFNLERDSSGWMLTGIFGRSATLSTEFPPEL